MSLKTRVKKLDASTKEAYEKTWDGFFSDISDRLPYFLNQKKLELEATHPESEADEEQALTAQSEQAMLEASAEEFLAALGDTPLHGFDVAAQVAWDHHACAKMPFSAESETWDLAHWPSGITRPPTEPPGIYDELKALLSDEGDKGLTAYHLLCSLEAARVVRRYSKRVRV